MIAYTELNPRPSAVVKWKEILFLIFLAIMLIGATYVFIKYGSPKDDPQTIKGPNQPSIQPVLNPLEINLELLKDNSDYCWVTAYEGDFFRPYANLLLCSIATHSFVKNVFVITTRPDEDLQNQNFFDALNITNIVVNCGGSHCMTQMKFESFVHTCPNFVFLDADTLLLRNADELFDVREGAVSGALNTDSFDWTSRSKLAGINSGVFASTRNPKIYDQVMKNLNQSWDDQEILNNLIRDDILDLRLIDKKYNYILDDKYIRRMKVYPKVLHLTGIIKPDLRNEDTRCILR